MEKILWIVVLFILGHSADAQITRKVCFIGNSYTSYNDLPGIINDLATSDGNSLLDTAMTPGGSTLEYHSTLSFTLVAIAADDWDYVVLQEQSQRPSFPWVQVTEDVIPYAEVLIDSIRVANACAIPVFFNTWGRRDGEPMWDSINTFTKMNQRLHHAYDYMADEFSAKLSPVGIGFEHIANDDETPVPFIDLYTGDGSHPSIFGSYLAACIFYEILFEETVVGNTFISDGIGTAQGNYLQSVAHHVVHEVDSVNISYTQPVADFEMDVDEFTITCTNMSEHAFSYLWDFGDGTTSTEENPVHTYAFAGTFTVDLMASYCDQEDVVTKEASTLRVEEETFSGFNSYPNPSVSGQLIFDSKKGIREVSILNLQGQIVDVVWVDGTQSVVLDPGTYLLVIDGKIVDKLMVY